MNHMEVTFDALSINESLARLSVAAFITSLNPSLDEMEDVKTAVSEAVTNAIIHGYAKDSSKGQVTMRCALEKNILLVSVIDKGSGIADIKKAMEPFYTTKPELERSGMGFAFMEAFMNEIHVQSKVGEGTIVTMKKVFVDGEE